MLAPSLAWVEEMLGSRNLRSWQRSPLATAAFVLALAGGSTQAQLQAPDNLRATPGDGQVQLSWGFSAHAAVTGFSFRYAANAAALSHAAPRQWLAIPGSTPETDEHLVRDLANGTRYYFQVRAVGRDGEGPVSAIATVELPTSPNELVEIPDDELRMALGNWGVPITRLDMARLTHLQANDRHITDLSGLEHLINSTGFDLSGNQITDLSPLGGLTALQRLTLAYNEVVDTSPLAGVTGLTHLDLAGNGVADVSALGGLTSLQSLTLDFNEIVDISALGNLTNLESLSLSFNRIGDVSPLRNLTALYRLFFYNNEVVDVSALGGLTGLNDLRLANNKIVDASALGNLTHLRRLHLSNNEIADVSAFGGLVNMDELILDNNAITDVSALGGLAALRDLYLNNNEIVDVSALGGLTGLVDLWLADNKIVDVSALGNLTRLNRLHLANNQITDTSALGGLEVRRLYLDNNQIADISAFKRMSWVSTLSLNGNKITDVSALSGLARLRDLWLADNQITDTSPLGTLELLHLCLAQNDIRHPGELPSLMQGLDLSDNAIADVTTLGNLVWPSPSWLNLSGNEIADVEPIGNLRPRELFLDDNEISDVSVLRPSDAIGGSISALYVENNQIADVSALVGRYGAGHSVALLGNPLSADAIERDVPAIRWTGTTVLSGRQVPLFPSTLDTTGREGLVRVLNRSESAGIVWVEAVDDAGVRRGPVRLEVGPGAAAHFDSTDLEGGNAAKGLMSGVGAPTAGDWRLELSSTLDIEALAYIRTPDGFLTSVHDVVPRYQRACSDIPQLARPARRPSDLHVAIFNPAHDLAQRSTLRLINSLADTFPADAPPLAWPTTDLGTSIWGIDDTGTLRVVDVIIPVGAATATAAQLERFGLGDGVGKWRLIVPAARSLEAMSLLESPDGYLTNLSTVPLPGADGAWRVPFFPAASSSRGQGFARIANVGDEPAEAAVVAVDDSGLRTEPRVLRLGPWEALHFDSKDLEQGNEAKGLGWGVGSPRQGDWRLEITSASDIGVTSFVRYPDGFLTSMHDVVPADGNVYNVVFFDPARNTRQVSLLRLANDSDAAATVSIIGVDDAGRRGGEVGATIPSGQATTFTAAQLEEGAPGLVGRMGSGQGKWQLLVAADRPLTVMSLLATSSGHLTNLSSRGDGGRRALRRVGKPYRPSPPRRWSFWRESPTWYTDARMGAIGLSPSVPAHGDVRRPLSTPGGDGKRFRGVEAAFRDRTLMPPQDERPALELAPPGRQASAAEQ